MTDYKTIAENVSFNTACGILTKLGYDVLKTETIKNDTFLYTRHHDIIYNEITGTLKVRVLESVKL